MTKLELIRKNSTKSKQPIDLMPVNTEHIVTSYKFKYTDDSFKYIIGYKEGEVVKPLCIVISYLKWMDT